METLATAVRCELTQLAPGGAAEVVHLELASGQVETCRSTFDLILRGTRPSGLATFLTTRRRPPGFALNGRGGGPDCLWAYGPGAEIHGALPRRSELTLIAIPESRLGMSEIPGDGTLGSRCRMLRPPPGVRVAVSRIVAAALDLARRQPAALHDTRRLHMENDLVEHLSLALQLGEASPGRRPGPVSRQFVLRTVDEQLETRRGEPLRVTELSTACGVSVRTLYNAFEEAHGVSPMAYVRLRRLNAVRRTLVRADPDETTVSEAALRWGFWHPGAFSVLYRGPSAKRRARRCADAASG